MLNISIIKVELQHIKELQKIGRKTFFETFSESNSEENMQKYLDESFSIEKLTSELTDKNAEFYFAVYDSCGCSKYCGSISDFAG